MKTNLTTLQKIDEKKKAGRKIKLIKGKALRKQSLYEKTVASVLLKLFISSNEWCHTTDVP